MIDALHAAFCIPDAVSVLPGINGLPKVQLTHHSGTRAEVYLHGGHITSWQDAQGIERFFVSRESHYAVERPIRGGIPVIFPQFGSGPLPQHGLARTSEWRLISTQVIDDAVSATLQLTDSPATSSDCITSMSPPV